MVVMIDLTLCVPHIHSLPKHPPQHTAHTHTSTHTGTEPPLRGLFWDFQGGGNVTTAQAPPLLPSSLWGYSQISLKIKSIPPPPMQRLVSPLLYFSLVDNLQLKMCFYWQYLL